MIFQSNHFKNKCKKSNWKDVVYTIVNKNLITRYNSYQY